MRVTSCPVTGKLLGLPRDSCMNDSEEIAGRRLIKHKARTMTDCEIAEVLEYIAIMQSMRDVRWLDPLDEVIMKLLFETMRSTDTLNKDRLVH
jgi:hypothetical protein